MTSFTIILVGHSISDSGLHCCTTKRCTTTSPTLPWDSYPPPVPSAGPVREDTVERDFSTSRPPVSVSPMHLDSRAEDGTTPSGHSAPPVLIPARCTSTVVRPVYKSYPTNRHPRPSSGEGRDTRDISTCVSIVSPPPYYSRRSYHLGRVWASTSSASQKSS